MAVSAAELVVINDGAPASPWRCAMTPPDGTVWPSLARALREGVAAGAVSSPVRLALLPPLVELRSVAIPPVSDADARRLLTRAASRHFLDARESMEVAVGSGTPAGRLAAAVPARLLRAVLEAAREANVHVELVVPAHAAWARTVSRPSAPDHAVLVELDAVRELITIAHGAPTAVRRFRLTGDDAALSEATRALAGPPQQLNDALVSAARALATDKADHWPLAFSGTAATSSTGPANARNSWWLLGAAAALALGTIALQELDVRRELAAVRAERAALMPSLAAVTRTANDDERMAVQALEAAPRWSSVLSALSEVLPRDTYVTRLRAQADTLVLEGRAQRAASAYDALSSAPWVRSAAASAPIRRETSSEGLVMESFEFTITLRTP